MVIMKCSSGINHSPGECKNQGYLDLLLLKTDSQDHGTWTVFKD